MPDLGEGNSNLGGSCVNKSPSVPKLTFERNEIELGPLSSRGDPIFASYADGPLSDR